MKTGGGGPYPPPLYFDFVTSQFGLLLPRSVLYPSIAFDVLEGTRAALIGAGEQIDKVWPESIGLGTDYNQIYAHCERMLMQGVAMVAAYINPSTAVQLQPLFAASRSILLVLDSGYHLPPAGTVLPNVFFLSLHGALCSRMAASMALEAGYRSFLFATSFYDAGYRAGYTMARAVEAAEANILATYVSPLRRADFSLQPLVPLFGSPANPAVLASYCGDMAEDFLNHLRAEPLKPKAVFTSPFMAEETWLSRWSYPGMEYTAVVPWSRTLSNDENLAFTSRLGDNPPTFFSVLGYEAGIIYAWLTASGLRGEAASTHLVRQAFETPRGPLRFDEATHQTQAPLYAAVVGNRDDSDRCAIVEVTQCSKEQVAGQWDLLQEDIAAVSPHADCWLNTYPCIDS